MLRRIKLVDEYCNKLEIEQKEGKIIIDFYSDCGKFGTDEMIAGYILTPKRLLEILKQYKDYEDSEL